LARLFGTRAVSDLVTALEGDEEEAYGEQSSPEVEAIAADEREHAEIWRRLKDPNYHPDRDIADRERWHRSGRSGTLVRRTISIPAAASVLPRSTALVSTV
jgi:hypothetical protein